MLPDQYKENNTAEFATKKLFPFISYVNLFNAGAFFGT